MDEDSRVGEVKKSNRVRGIFCSIWKTPYHRNCNCLAEEIDDIIDEYSITFQEQSTIPKRKRGRPKKVKIDKIIDHPSTSVSNKNMDPKKKWRQTYFNNVQKEKKKARRLKRMKSLEKIRKKKAELDLREDKIVKKLEKKKPSESKDKNIPCSMPSEADNDLEAYNLWSSENECNSKPPGTNYIMEISSEQSVQISATLCEKPVRDIYIKKTRINRNFEG